MTDYPFTTNVRLSRIAVPANRLRPAYDHRVEVIAQSFAKLGQQQAIILRPAGADDDGFTLVDGGHRLEAAKRLGWETIRAEVHELSELLARAVEVETNINHEDLSALDRSLFNAERKRLWDALYPDTGRGGDRKSLDAREKIKRTLCPFDFSETFTKEAAARAGVSDRTIRRDIELASSLSPEAIALIRDTPLADNAAQLRLLAKEAPEDQVHLAGFIAGRSARNVKAARVLAEMQSPPERDPQQAIFDKLVVLYGRANAKTRRRFEEHVGLHAPSHVRKAG